MLAALRAGRSLFSVLLVGLYFLLGSPVLRLVVIPGAYLFPAQRFRLVSLYMKAMSAGLLALLRLGGARVRRSGRIPTAQPVLIIGNHQSLTDILQVSLLASPRVPAFVPRKRYERFVPLVSACIRLLGCPIVDPKRDPEGAVEAIRAAVRELPHGLLIFPEGHRTRDGRILPFRPSGTIAALAERPLPVYLVLNDGVFRVARFKDLLFRVYEIDAWSEAIGPFTPPDDPSEHVAFLAMLRDTLVARLEQHRQTQGAR
jgi:1-acyl-sn-glycerol-3-phosphate acyltransferase